MSVDSTTVAVSASAGASAPAGQKHNNASPTRVGGFKLTKRHTVTAGGSIAVLIIFLAAWQWLPGWLGMPEFILPKFTTVMQESVHMWQTGNFLEHFGYTALEVVLGFILGALLGLFVGVVLGLSPTTESVLSPYILALQIAPKVAFAPLFVMWLGYTIYPKILVALLIVFFPIMVNVLSAIRTVDPDMVNLVRTLNASRWQIFRLVEFPSALPSLFSGLRIGATLAVIGVTVGELVGGNKGLGFLLVDAEGQGNTAGVFVSIIGLTVIGIIAYAVVVWFERRCLHYIPKATVTTA
ncbi:NitT/TauT family transport system permease protein [Pusillimonas noertemannii]|uniref:NitT/TauT family transport system permease protein n=1 Tax=Pusillimonas noertemannii TaxID=305977 RepID=A0A2U1CJS7_9BURK|nr:ABC transporter permease [Pusillimonas noertemannii]PVY61234.1 NitT/TauT family transport system permease protein [Pusillimonas noertemannii]TFL09142.1 ABC transporter permease [Pusillimonas noertemannii]